MALNTKTVNSLMKAINQSDYDIFRSSVVQLFSYLKSEVADNPVFDKYMLESSAIAFFAGSNRKYFIADNDFPPDVDGAKIFSFAAFRYVIEQPKTKGNIPITLFSSERDFQSATTKFKKVFYDFFSAAIDDILKANSSFETNEVERIMGKKTFIIHGHNNQMKLELQLLLKIAGVNSVVLHEITDGGRTIIDKLVDEAKDANYAIALLSPDDLLYNGVARARQNVIFEIGYFMGKLGKERIRMLVSDNVEIPSDLQGILYQKHDDNGTWKIKLLKELMAVGIYVDIDAVTKSM